MINSVHITIITTVTTDIPKLSIKFNITKSFDQGPVDKLASHAFLCISLMLNKKTIYFRSSLFMSTQSAFHGQGHIYICNKCIFVSV